MNIGFFTDTYLPGVGGTEVSMEMFRKDVEKMGHKIFIYAPYFSNYKDVNPNVFRFKALRIMKSPEMRLAIPIFPKKPSQLKEILDFKLDIVHCHTPFTMGFLGRYIAKRQNIPLVYTHHTRIPAYAIIHFKEKIVLPYMGKALSKFFANQAQLTIAPSYKFKKILQDYGVKTKIAVLPTGIDVPIFKKTIREKKKKRKELGISPKTKVLLFVGRICEGKNVSFLPKVLKEVLKTRQDVLLIMIGNQGHYFETLKTQAQDLGVEKFIKYINRVPYPKLPDFYNLADVFVYPSLSETQGLVVLEAAASGLSIVALDDSAYKGVVVNKKNGFLIKKESVSLFAKKVLELLENEKLRKRFSLNSEKIAIDFSAENQAKKLVDIYQGLIKK